jgi:hypothetical protein
LLDELAAAGVAVDSAAAGDFLERIDKVTHALDAYANPELAVDALLLAWPRLNGAGRAT